jgi:hypothetical protein
MTSNSPLSLVECFKQISEPRVVRRCDHELVDILVIALSSVLCGGEGFNDMEDFGKAKEQWFRSFLSLRHGIPSHDTFNRVFAALKPETFLECFLKWTQGVRQAISQEVVALDGKALLVDDTLGDTVWAYDFLPKVGMKKRAFAKIPQLTDGESLADGMCIDHDGRVYVTTGAGIQIFDKKGKFRGIIKTPR